MIMGAREPIITNMTFGPTNNQAKPEFFFGLEMHSSIALEQYFYLTENSNISLQYVMILYPMDQNVVIIGTFTLVI